MFVLLCWWWGGVNVSPGICCTYQEVSSGLFDPSCTYRMPKLSGVKVARRLRGLTEEAGGYRRGPLMDQL